MKNYSNKQKKLYNEIALLKLRQTQQESDIQKEFYETAEQLKPSKIIKKTLATLYKEPIVKESVFNSSLSLITGYISRKVIIGKSNSFIKSVIGHLSQVVISKLVSKQINT